MTQSNPRSPASKTRCFYALGNSPKTRKDLC
jgi:hypothetical protein